MKVVIGRDEVELSDDEMLRLAKVTARHLNTMKKAEGKMFPKKDAELLKKLERIIGSYAMINIF